MRWLIHIVLVLIPMAGVAQQTFEVSPTEKEQFVRDAQSVVKRYGLNLIELGDSLREPWEKQVEEVAILNLFDRTDVLVPNDIDASGEQSKEKSISAYLSTLKINYSRFGLDIDTRIDRSRSNALYIDSKSANPYLFVKVVVERSLKGKNDQDISIDTTLWLDVYVLYWLNGDGTYDPNAYIYAIEPHDPDTKYEQVPIKGERPQAVARVDQQTITSPTTPKPTEESVPTAQSQPKQTDTDSQKTVPVPQEPKDCPYKPPRFVSSSDHKRLWKEFVYSSNAYRKAVLEKGVRGSGTIWFTVKADGAIYDPTLGIDSEVFEGKEYAIKEVAQQLMTESSSNGNAWIPAEANCEKVARQVSEEVTFELHRVKSKGSELTPSNRVQVPQNEIPPKPLSRKQQRRGERANRKEERACAEEYRRPRFNSCSRHKKEWRAYVGKNNLFVKAVLQDGVRGFVDASASITRNGDIEPGSTRIRLGNHVRKRFEATDVAIKLIEGSTEGNNKWIPGKHQGAAVQKRGGVHLAYGKSWLDPNTAIESGLLTERGKRKMKRKAAWLDHKKEKIGGVHFNIGGGYAFPLGANGFKGGVAEAAFGGLFGHHVGMELKYRTVIDQQAGRWFENLSSKAQTFVQVDRASTLLHTLSLGLIFNTSKKRVRPYFTIHGGVNWLSIDVKGQAQDFGDASPRYGAVRYSTDMGWHLSPGFGIDFKIPKYGSFFIAGEFSMYILNFRPMEFDANLGSNIILFSNHFSLGDNLQLPVTIGFRFSRW